MLRILALLCCAAAPVLAQSDRAGDSRFSAEVLSERLAGAALTFFDGSVSSYAADGGYGYVYAIDGPVWAGQWSTNEDSEVCVAFDNGSSRCDRIVENGGRLVLITEDGDRFPIRDVGSVGG